MENIKDQSKKLEVAEIQLSYKSNVKASDRPKISGSRDAKNVLMNSWDLSRIELLEQFKVLFTNRANQVLGILELSTGGMYATVVDPKLVFVAALKAGASGIILSHNHPSGNVMPSQADIDLTKKIKDGAKLLEIQLLDHIIITNEKYYSFGDEGLI
ncbi:JAB domain-containing protein [Pseudochryseolinea flava]|uniref:DNA repair protein n=1 Tax=Pseudochryseolinea flava TaxID=2059302 RepID=A0A364Y4X3_9BACT|nr:JAB domain-containing protein [Pseudochryseolinea flava]RAW01091.1 DNA repair protein [Pseudochryseolinea flava]